QNEYKDIANKHFNHSADYLKDGINALNTAFVQQGALFIAVKRGKIVSHPVYIYNITDGAVLALPRTLMHLAENSQVQIVETFVNVANAESFTNQIMEIVVEKAAILDYCKIQNEGPQANQVSTTHIRQTGKSLINAVTISLNGGIVRNNTNVVMEAPYCEAHLYGLYYPKGNTLIDNHTVVDNVEPNCYSNELYKGMLDENGTGVFNGKIFVRQPAQKTNAFQSNKNVLLSDTASVNTKPQLEIFADDVKCSHGCTVGKLNEDGLFYLQSRGVPEKTAKAMLLHGFAGDIIEKIKIEAIREYVDQLVSERLGYEA
ncbi:MAG: Fe-S cluster assembly protein SufD, partial [Chitinophagaceae bacterium]